MLELTDTPANARAFASQLDSMHGLPSRGIAVGPGPHCVLVSSWDGSGPVPVGWTSHLGGLTGTGLEVVETQVVNEGDQRLLRLTGQERAAYVSERAKLTSKQGMAPEGAERKQP